MKKILHMMKNTAKYNLMKGLDVTIPGELLEGMVAKRFYQQCLSITGCFGHLTQDTLC